MKLTTKAISEIKKNQRLKNRLALELEKSGYTVERWITENEDNGFLTTAKSLQIIKQETDLTDSEILEEEAEKEPVR
jgi:hypothetical protein